MRKVDQKLLTAVTVSSVLRRQIGILAFDEAQKLIRVYDELHAAHTAADGDCIK